MDHVTLRSAMFHITQLRLDANSCRSTCHASAACVQPLGEPFATLLGSLDTVFTFAAIMHMGYLTTVCID